MHYVEACQIGWYRAAVTDGFRRVLSPRKYQAIAQKTLLVWGLEAPALDHDVLVPGTEAFVPKLQVAKIPGTGHFVHAERPEVVNPALLEFVRRPNASAGPSSWGQTSSPSASAPRAS